MLWSLCEKGRLKLQFFMGAGGSTLQVLGKKTMQIPEPHWVTQSGSSGRLAQTQTFWISLSKTQGFYLSATLNVGDSGELTQPAKVNRSRACMRRPLEHCFDDLGCSAWVSYAYEHHRLFLSVKWNHRWSHTMVWIGPWFSMRGRSLRDRLEPKASAAPSLQTTPRPTLQMKHIANETHPKPFSQRQNHCVMFIHRRTWDLSGISLSL